MTDRMMRFIGLARLKREGYYTSFDLPDGVDPNRDYKHSDVEHIAGMIHKYSRFKRINFAMRDEAMKIIDYVNNIKEDE